MGNFHPPSSPRKKSGKKFYHDGFYKCQNPLKYIGDVTKIVFRSKWEWYFMVYCDQTDIIVKWSCEHIVIPYQDAQGHIHRYYPDIYIEKINPQNPNDYVRAIIEIKPRAEIMPDFVNADGSILHPNIYLKKVTAKAMESYEYKLRTFQKNLQKWTKAKDWCQKHQMQFFLIDEYYLKEKKIM